MSRNDNFDNSPDNSEQEPSSVQDMGFSRHIDRPEEPAPSAREEGFSEPSLDEAPRGLYSLIPDEPVPDPLFQTWSQPEVIPPTRIPHLGHLCLLAGAALSGFTCAAALMLTALHFHFDGVATMEKAAYNVHYDLGSETVIYLVGFSLCLIFFPMFWNKGFFAGIQWRGATALRLYWQLVATAAVCFGLAAIEPALFKNPPHAPIEDIFRSPGAAWLMFGFGVTFAPFFEEIAFRGFLLPSLATACDWVGERFTDKDPPPLDGNGHPQWSLPAMVIASIATSLPFAMMHLEQQGKTLGPFIQVLAVSLILCAVRLRTRSLAASTLVHACYNFMIFSLMMIGTDGFRHLDKL